MGLRLKKHWLSILLAAACVVLAALFWSEHQAAGQYEQEILHSQESLTTANGRLAAALEEDMFSSTVWLRAVKDCATVQTELDFQQRQLKHMKQPPTEALQQLGGLERFYESVERYLTQLLEEKAETLSVKDQSVVRFIRTACQQVYDRQDPEKRDAAAFLDGVYNAVGGAFEKTFHTFDMAAFFRANDPLETFFEV